MLLELERLVKIAEAKRREKKLNIIVDLIENAEDRTALCSEVDDKTKKTALHLALEGSCPTKIVKEILEANPEALKMFDKRGDTPMHVAARPYRNFSIQMRSPDEVNKTQEDNLALLLKMQPKGAEIFRDKYPHFLPLHLACQRYEDNIVSADRMHLNTTMIKMLLKVFPEAAHCTGFEKDDTDRIAALRDKGVAAKPIEMWQRLKLPINMVAASAESTDFFLEQEQEPRRQQWIKQARDILIPHSPEHWKVTNDGLCTACAVQ